MQCHSHQCRLVCGILMYRDRQWPLGAIKVLGAMEQTGYTWTLTTNRRDQSTHNTHHLVVCPLVSCWLKPVSSSGQSPAYDSRDSVWSTPTSLLDTCAIYQAATQSGSLLTSAFSHIDISYGNTSNPQAIFSQPGSIFVQHCERGIMDVLISNSSLCCHQGGKARSHTKWLSASSPPPTGKTTLGIWP